MFSHLAKKGKQLIVLTLLMGVLAMPVSPLIAEEIIDAPAPTPVVSDIPIPEIVPETETDPVVILADPVPILDCVASTTDQIETTPAPSSIQVQTSPGMVQTGTMTEIITENSFTTLSEETVPTLDAPPANPDPVADETSQSEENNFQTLGEITNLDNLAISAEESRDTASGETNNNPWAESDETSFITLNWPVDTVAVSAEGSFNTTATPANTLAVSAESSFTTQTVVIVNEPVVSGEGNFTTLAPIVNLLAISAEQNFSTLTAPVNTLAVSPEQNFSTPATPVNTLAISGENNFTTLPGGGPVTEPAISAETSFTTITASVNTLAISAEQNFTTLTAPIDTLAIGPEISFTTATAPIDTLAVSDEISFTTLTAPIDTLAVSDELAFNILNNPVDNLAISDEASFTTETGPNPSPPTPPSGGGGSSSGGRVLSVQTYNCPIYLTKFIKYGEPNDHREVIKLQAFLKVFEGFKDLKITGVYDQETLAAVRIFQTHYLRDILKPWGLEGSTGFVYITTRLAINNIYCGRDTKNNLRFREQVAYEYRLATGKDWETPLAETEERGYFIVPTTTSTTTSSIVRPNVFLAGVGELLNFIGDNFCWLLNLLLLLLIFFLLWLLWLASHDENEEIVEIPEPDQTTGHSIDPFLGAIPLADILDRDDEEALTALVDEEESKTSAANNNPEQEAIFLGPESTKAEETKDPESLTGSL